MSLSSVTVPKTAVQALASSLVPPDVVDKRTIELVITIDDRNLNVRDFGAYLSLADRVYGRMHEAGLSSYARKAPEQLVIHEVRRGSLQLVVTQVVSQPSDAAALAVLWLCLKHLPAGDELPFAGTDSRPQSPPDQLYHNGVSDERVDREARKRLREAIRQDRFLGELDSREVGQLAALLGGMYAAERRHLPACARFARKSVSDIAIGARARVSPPENRYPLRGTPYYYEDPTLPVAEDDWEAAR